MLLTGGSSGMGRALAKMLAQRGANVVIVARRKDKLDETIGYIQVVTLPPSAHISFLMPYTETRSKARPTLPGHQRRRDLRRRKCPHRVRDHGLEQQHPTRHYLGQCRRLSPRPLRRLLNRHPTRPIRHQLLERRLPSPTSPEALAPTRHPYNLQATQTLHHDIQQCSLRRRRRLCHLRPRKSRSPLPSRLPAHGSPNVQRSTTFFSPQHPTHRSRNPHRMPRHHRL